MFCSAVSGKRRHLTVRLPLRVLSPFAPVFIHPAFIAPSIHRLTYFSPPRAFWFLSVTLNPLLSWLVSIYTTFPSYFSSIRVLLLWGPFRSDGRSHRAELISSLPSCFESARAPSECGSIKCRGPGHSKHNALHHQPHSQSGNIVWLLSLRSLFIPKWLSGYGENKIHSYSTWFAL